MKKLTVILFILLGVLYSAFAEDSNIIYQKTRAQTINANTQEALTLGETVTGEYKGNYCLIALTYDRSKNIGTCYAIYCADKQKSLTLLLELESTDGRKITYASYMEELVKDTKQYMLVEDTLDVQGNAIIKSKNYYYFPL